MLTIAKIRKSECMETRKPIEIEKFASGTRNCPQAVICTYDDLYSV